jgi:two-component system response regulator
MIVDAPILLVEDNPDDLALTLRALAKNQIRNPIQTAGDGQAALSWLATRGAPDKPLPALVLLDLKMPILDGLETLAQIRAQPATALLRVIMLTTSAEEQDLIASYQRGVNSYIRKPVDYQTFVTAMGIVGLYWLSTNQPPLHGTAA